ncbi:MAG: hypothetical protein CMN28_02990 [Salinisphaeraceae bacterium]|nr:hypothetical protein [Salinisphaeraceae bacterium]
MSAPNATEGSVLLDSRPFWLTVGVLAVLLHLGGIYLYATQGFENLWARLWGIIVVLHVLEIPLAFVMLRGRGIAWGLTIWNTLVFGFAWWVPARRGVYHPNAGPGRPGPDHV